MKWETVTSTIGNSVYALWNNGRKLVTLVFNSSSNAARIEYGTEKRVFLIRKEGFRKNKTVLRDEYGMRVGYMGSENNVDFIELNNERFFYSLEDSDHPAVTIYKESKDQPLAVCDLNIVPNDVLGSLRGKKIDDDTRYSLLMTLCWYLFQPAVKASPLTYSMA